MTTLKRRIAGSLAAAALVAGLGACGLSPIPMEDQGTQATVTTEQEPSAKGDTSAVDVPVEVTDMDLSTEAYATNDMAYEVEPYIGSVETFNTEEYDSVEETGFVSTLATPLSTVSADVDTASYANLRRMLEAGYRVSSAEDRKAEDDSDDKDDVAEDETREYDGYDDYSYGYDVIPKGAVRIEEMLNYFNYDYATPEGDDGFAVTAKVGACPWNKDTELLVLGFATGHEDKSVSEAGSNLVFLIDVSGSMDDPDKLPLLQDAFAELVEGLDDKDRVSIVTYSGEEEVVLEGESGANHRAITRAVDRLRADGSTNGEAGLRMAYELAEKYYIKGGVNRIVMASDGDLNVGMTSESDLHDFVDKKRESGVYLSVLGFGSGNYKDTKMETLADHGNGSYHYIDCRQEAKRVFGERLTANLVPFADDVKVQVEFNPAQIKGYRLIGYENRTMAAEDFKDDAKDAGEVGPESQFTVAYEIVRADSAMEIATPELKYGQEATDATSTEWLTAKLRYKPVSGGDVVEQSQVVDEKDVAEDPGDDWRFAAAVTEFGMLLRDSEFKGTSSYDSVRELVGETKDELRQGFLDLVDLAQKN